MNRLAIWFECCFCWLGLFGFYDDERDISVF